MQAPEFTNDRHQQKILKLNEEIDDLIKNKYAARRGCFDNVLYFIKKNSKEVYPYYVIQRQYRQLEKYKNVLIFVIQAWKRPAGVMIQMLFTHGTYSRVK